MPHWYIYLTKKVVTCLLCELTHTNTHTHTKYCKLPMYIKQEHRYLGSNCSQTWEHHILGSNCLLTQEHHTLGSDCMILAKLDKVTRGQRNSHIRLHIITVHVLHFRPTGSIIWEASTQWLWYTLKQVMHLSLELQGNWHSGQSVNTTW